MEVKKIRSEDRDTKLGKTWKVSMIKSGCHSDVQ